MREIRSEEGVPPTAPISQAVQTGDTIHVSGQTGRDPETREIVSDDVGDQTARIFENVANVLDAAGASLDDISKVTVYLTDLGDKDTFNEVYAEYMTEPYPARAVVGVDALAPGAKVELEITADVSQ